MAHFSRRLPHVLPPAELGYLVAPSYAAALGVDEEEARERLEQILAHPGAVEDLYRGLSEALREAQGPRTGEDALMDKLSARLARRRGRVRAAEATPALSAVLVRLNLEVGLAPEPMRAPLATERGRALLEEGLTALGRHIVKELLRG